MMNTFYLAIGAIYLFVLNGNYAASLPKYEQQLALRGRVIFPGGSRLPIESDAVLTVELLDTSLADAPAKTFARSVGKAIRFPMAFALKYSPRIFSDGHSYSIQVTIRNKQNELLYINDVRMEVIPIGADRTKLIDIPVILVKKSPPKQNKSQWPELVGKNGNEAVKIIKQETGFTNVMVVKEGSLITMDYRANRVRVFVDKQGNVKASPSVA
ncbi:unnamed protein product [Adineta steineri]|uniref:Uncharacterized protein n=1 Tax=Adineta steineri TaxID=433720 RepID=A0A818PY13_9BILA|nr:unnamed protein product [Adineta steineri]CAF3628367.1 unnamed protein product [Adineta steineri]